MKTIKIITAAILFATIISTSCTKEPVLIEGDGNITTKSLDIAKFSKISVEGADDVIIKYGNEQQVVVTGNPNIIDRIRTEVNNDTWYIELENGNYGEYELTYYLTLPSLEQVSTSGTGDVVVTDSMAQEELKISLTGAGSFMGFPMRAGDCQVDITGTGNCEITVDNSLDVTIDGTGSVYYKGNPTVHTDISGTGSVNQVN